jgi:uncharacterized protein (TIGR02246 family)
MGAGGPFSLLLALVLGGGGADTKLDSAAESRGVWSVIPSAVRWSGAEAHGVEGSPPSAASQLLIVRDAFTPPSLLRSGQNDGSFAGETVAFWEVTDKMTELGMADDRRAIEALHEKDMAASEAGDLFTLLSLCSDDCVMLPPGEAPIVGKEAIRASLQRDLEQEHGYRITEYIHDFEEVKVLGDWAFEWGRFSATAEPVAGGAPIRSSGKILRILARQADSTWKVARSIWNNDPAPGAEG